MVADDAIFYTKNAVDFSVLFKVLPIPRMSMGIKTSERDESLASAAIIT
jgi:hypothetical protein